MTQYRVENHEAFCQSEDEQSNRTTIEIGQATMLRRRTTDEAKETAETKGETEPNEDVHDILQACKTYTRMTPDCRLTGAWCDARP